VSFSYTKVKVSLWTRLLGMANRSQTTTMSDNHSQNMKS